ncbi:inositol monophosphatase family protein [Natronospira bacteriovora]|uniref:Inositol-1-monophosphatase n=1 Tax=Natronospira bacteriovora TaxID=3069753 RepID=A0ABU0W452_9GAMM|nr:inositol monophosphatase family protein [Natronospira sp. AB-CW4]MDQ2068801.1 inositol monophosphatase family protein [Natronospira sp. AB-CW4]
MHPLLNIAVRAARSAGDHIIRRMGDRDRLSVSSKKRNDFVSEVDHEAEGLIIDLIRRNHRDHAVLAEESGSSGDSDHLWIIDPLDGTTNFLHGLPVFAVSIAYQYKGKLEHGVIYDPVRQELFTASRGSGAFLDDRRIRVGNLRGLDGALIGTGFPYTDHRYLDEYLAMFRAIIQKTAGVRRPGAAAIDLAWLAAGRFDGFWEMGLKPWDIAAGALLIREAGGMVGSLSGGTDYLESGHIMAGNPKVFAALAREIRPHLPAEMR